MKSRESYIKEVLDQKLFVHKQNLSLVCRKELIDGLSKLITREVIAAEKEGLPDDIG